MKATAFERFKWWLGDWFFQIGVWAGVVCCLLWLIGTVAEAIQGSLTYSREASVGVYGMMILIGINLAWHSLRIVFGATRVRPDVLALVAPPMAGCAAISIALLLYTGKSWAAANYIAPLVTLVLSIYSWYFARHSEWTDIRITPAPEPTPAPAQAAVGSEPADPGQALPEESPARQSQPTSTFADIHGNDAIKTRIGEAANAILGATGGKAPRNGILLFGGPGNGKTALAQALAGELRLPLLTISVADIKSKWIGVGVERLRATFDHAIELQPCVLFIDEIDSLLASRDDRLGTIKDDQDMTNALLTLLVDIRSSRLIVVAATNHLDRLDSAGIREGRFDFKVEITPPDEPARIGLLRQGVRTCLPNATVTPELIETVARRWNGFSVKRILAVTEELPAYLVRQGLGAASTPAFEDFMGALRAVQGRRGAALENVKTLDQLVLAKHTREMLDLIVARMADPEYTERHGGTLPTGVLFQGPHGTGKTTACKALAHAIQWAFLPATGSELARDPAALRHLYDKATELRPTIIFVDEADELLRNRLQSASPEATNLLLTLMDGVGERVRDVVWIAATNHPETIDPALLRGGRFAEKVRFEWPARQELVAYLGRWLVQRKARLHDGLRTADVVELMGAQSIADAEAVIQQALNRALSRRTCPVVIGRADVLFAKNAVLGY